MHPHIPPVPLPHSSTAQDWPAERSARAKGATRVSVVVPARDEEATIGAIVASIHESLVRRVGLVDELLVVDSRSIDATASVAAAAGARVVTQDRVLDHLPPLDGKGEALWKGLAASSGDVVAFIDGDLRDFDPAFVSGLVGPLLADRSIDFVKGFYHRPLQHEGGETADGGGRVSELVARPLINMHWPTLAGFVQPLAGEYAGRRSLLQSIPFVTGYGVELGMLVDVLDTVGLDAMAQVDLGRRVHRHHDLEGLGRMAAQILLTAEMRRASEGREIVADLPATTLAQFRRRAAGGAVTGIDRDVVVTDVSVGERPPLRDVLHALRTGRQLLSLSRSAP